MLSKAHLCQGACLLPELIVIKPHSYYTLVEFTAVIAVTVCIPPSGNAEAACDVTHGMTGCLQTKHRDAFITTT